MSVYTIDFDGTLCQEAFPLIGKPIITTIEQVKQLKQDGHQLILWTCREGQYLTDAIEWCKCFGLVFDTHNANLPERIALYGTDPRKIGADYYIDDKNVMVSGILQHRILNAIGEVIKVE